MGVGGGPHVSRATHGTSEEAPFREIQFPTAFTVLAAVLVLVWIASFFVPAGT